MNIGIVGYGVVGQAVQKTLKPGGHKFVTYDIQDKRSSRRKIDACDLVFICVPTPESPDGSCDTSIVEKVVSWVNAPMCIRSTVPPGTTTRLRRKYIKPLCFSPEFLGETPWHSYHNLERSNAVIVGGNQVACKLVISAYKQTWGPGPVYWRTDSMTAELCKYMTNCYLATKVAFVNQFFDIAALFGVDFDELRELWLFDDRVGRSHTIVTPERAYGGKCLPKDMAAIIQAVRLESEAPLLQAVEEYNDSLIQRGRK